MAPIEVNGITLDYEVTGDGPPLILIAGLGYSKWMWHRMVPGLAAHFQVITFDNRGVGASSKPPGPYTAQLLADDTVALLWGLSLPSAHVMGHSMGGFIAQAMVLAYPECVQKLVLSATNFGGPRHIPVTPEALAVLTDTNSPPLERLRRGILISCTPGFEREQPEVVDEWMAWRASHPLDPAGYQAQLGIGMALLQEDQAFEHKLGTVNHDTLILFGADDKVVPPANAELLHQVLVRSEVVILPRAGHFYPMDSPGAATHTVIPFLKR